MVHQVQRVAGGTHRSPVPNISRKPTEANGTRKLATAVFVRRHHVENTFAACHRHVLQVVEASLPCGLLKRKSIMIGDVHISGPRQAALNRPIMSAQFSRVATGTGAQLRDFSK
jgi:hypothetical protein